jgi:MFS family permease
VVAAVAFAFSLSWLPKLVSERRPRLDLLGTVLLTSALSLVVYGLIEGEPRHWAQPIPAVIGVGLVIFVLFAIVQFRRRDREPLVPMAVVRSPGFTLMSIVSAALTCAVAAMVFLTAIFLQSVAGLDPFDAGLVIAAAPLISLPFALLSGWLTDRYGGFVPLLIGLLLMTIGLAGFPLALTNSVSLLPALAIFGIGMGIVYAPPGTLAMAHIDPALAGAASGTMNTLRALGNSLTSAVVAAWLQIRLADVPTGLHIASAGLTAALAGTYWIPVVVLAVTTLACALRARTLSARG